jgi:hypothetical protein
MTFGYISPLQANELHRFSQPLIAVTRFCLAVITSDSRRRSQGPVIWEAFFAFQIPTAICITRKTQLLLRASSQYGKR